MYKLISSHQNFLNTIRESTKTGNRTENRTPDHPENFIAKWTSISKEIYLHKKFFDRTIRSTKTGNRIENRTPDRPENFMNESVCHYKFICIKIFVIGPLEVQKPETRQKTRFQSRKFFSMKVGEFNGKCDGTIKFTIWWCI